MNIINKCENKHDFPDNALYRDAWNRETAKTSNQAEEDFQDKVNSSFTFLSLIHLITQA